MVFSFKNINQIVKKIHPSSGGIDNKKFLFNFQKINQTFKIIHPSLGEVNYI